MRKIPNRSGTESYRHALKAAESDVGLCASEIFS